MLEKSPDNHMFMRRIARNLRQLQEIYMQQGKIENATSVSPELLSIRKRLFEAAPDDFSNTGTLIEALLGHSESVGAEAPEAGRKSARDCIDIIDRAEIEKGSIEAEILQILKAQAISNLAFFSIVSDDAAGALTLAERAESVLPKVLTHRELEEMRAMTAVLIYRNRAEAHINLQQTDAAIAAIHSVLKAQLAVMEFKPDDLTELATLATYYVELSDSAKSKLPLEYEATARKALRMLQESRTAE